MHARKGHENDPLTSLSRAHFFGALPHVAGRVVIVSASSGQRTDPHLYPLSTQEPPETNIVAGALGAEPI